MHENGTHRGFGPRSSPGRSRPSRPTRSLLPAARRRRALAGVVAAVALAGAVVLVTRGNDPPAPDVDALAQGDGTLVGVHLRPDDRSEEGERAAFEALEDTLGRRLDIDHSFYAWDKPIVTWRERWNLQNGRIPMISWNGRGAYASAIAAGQHDAWIRQQADAVRRLEEPVLIRWFWEMDGNKKAEWAESPADYVAAWRRIRTTFRNMEALNVRWVWCPNASAFKTGQAQEFYPGDEWVDWICADGYNWAPGRPRDRWRSFEEIFDGFYDWAARRDKPLMIGEFGVQEREPGEKAAWIGEMHRTVKHRFPRVRALVYFDAHADHDWRLSTSESATEAFRRLATDPWFNPARAVTDRAG